MKETNDWCDLNKYKSVSILEGEVWKLSDEINSKMNTEGYEVSCFGRVRRVKTSGECFVFAITDNSSGYKRVALYFKSKTKHFYIHRLVAKAFLPNPDNLPQVNHKPSGLGKFDNRVEHLEWSSCSHNIKDAHVNGQMENRTKNANIDIRPASFIKEMYLHYKATGKVGETARLFGVPRTTLSSIVNKRSRCDVTDPLD